MLVSCTIRSSVGGIKVMPVGCIVSLIRSLIEVCKKCVFSSRSLRCMTSRCLLASISSRLLAGASCLRFSWSSCCADFRYLQAFLSSSASSTWSRLRSCGSSLTCHCSLDLARVGTLPGSAPFPLDDDPGGPATSPVTAPDPDPGLLRAAWGWGRG